jgi:hypothetical protein
MLCCVAVLFSTQHPLPPSYVLLATVRRLEGAYTQQGHAHSRRLHPDEAARPATAFFWGGGAFYISRPRRARLRAAPLPHPHNALLATPCCCAPAGGPRREPGDSPQHRAPASVHLEGGSVAAGASSVRLRRQCELLGVGAGQQQRPRPLLPLPTSTSAC